MVQKSKTISPGTAGLFLLMFVLAMIIWMYVEGRTGRNTCIFKCGGRDKIHRFDFYFVFPPRCECCEGAK